MSRVNLIKEVYDSLPVHFKEGIRNQWCQENARSKRSLELRVSGSMLFRPDELESFERIVSEYQSCLLDQQEPEPAEPSPAI